MYSNSSRLNGGEQQHFIGNRKTDNLEEEKKKKIQTILYFLKLKASFLCIKAEKAFPEPLCVRVLLIAF